MFELGLLPRQAPAVVFAARLDASSGCSLCHQNSPAVECELLFPDDKKVRFHRLCYEAWLQGRLQYRPA
jgi:hypothetical protein